VQKEKEKDNSTKLGCMTVDKEMIQTGKNKLIQLPSVCFYGLNTIFQLELP
jgi:hypothetical protein